MDDIKIYDHISKLPLAKFIDAICGNDLSALVISGTPTEEELLEAWEVIWDQYHAALQGNENQAAKLQKELVGHKINLFEVHLRVNVLRGFYVKEFQKRLNNILECAFVLDPEKPEEYDEMLDRYLSRSKMIGIKIELLESAIDEMIKTETSSRQPITREWFDKVLVTLSDHAKYDLNENTLSVSKFCERLIRLNNMIIAENLSRQANT